MEEDWDNLLILDACRYDMFAKINYLKGRLEFRRSRGSNTSEFLLENYQGKKYKDTVYITANPLVDYNIPDSFFKLISVWKEKWDEDLSTILPQTMNEYALNAVRDFPRKRLIVHYMQPHYPFIGEKSREKIGEHEGILSRNLILGEGQVRHKKLLVWNMLKQGQVDKQTVWQAYEENLEIVLKHVEALLKELPGKTVITSDHGNLFGERAFPYFWLKEYAHPRFCLARNLIQVPWLVIDSDYRRNITESDESQESVSLEELERNNIKEKLEALGYYN